ncbi:MAG: hypothetical protein F9K44_14910 [Hyphomicrobiaceae bacterium]|nr:MAG: hypothetical protein F9K44_14910 [Hyphomicrobiaceae bacterium]
MKMVLLALAVLVSAVPAMGQAPAGLTLKGDSRNPYALLKVGQYTLTSIKDGPIEQQQASEASLVKSVGLSLKGDSDLGCKVDDIEKALSFPNRAPSDKCVFAAELTIVLDKKLAYLVTGACGEWVDNVAKCRISKQGGQFWVMRDAARAAKRFSVVLGPSSNDVRFPPDKEGQNYGLLIGEIRATKTSPATILWLTWPERSVLVKFVRG